MKSGSVTTTTNWRKSLSEEAERTAMLRRRRTGIGGSDVGAILGVDRYRDALDVYLDKVQPSEDEATPEMVRGQYLEPVVTKMYQDYTGRRLKPGKFRRHREHDFLIGHPDRIIVARDRPPYTNPFDGAGVLEAKTANRYVFDRMRVEGLPQSYVLQLQHYMGVCGVKWGAFAVLCPDPWQFVTFDLVFDTVLFENVAPVVERFWTEHVLAKVPPQPPKVDWSDAPEIGKGEQVINLATDEKLLAKWLPALTYLSEAKLMRAEGEKAEEHAKSLLKEIMVDRATGEPQYGVYEDGAARVYYRMQDGRMTLDERSLAAMQPLDPISMATLLSQAGLGLDVIEEFFTAARLDLGKFKKKGKPFETLRVYDAKEKGT
jgi:putative phage-type endonuclease